jgi:hypothetical protein
MLFKPSLMYVKVTVAVLMVLAAGLFVKIYNSENEINILYHNLEIDKKIHNNEISEILIRYDSVLATNQRLNAAIFTKTGSLPLMINSELSIKTLQRDISNLKKGNFTKENHLATLTSILRSKQIELENNKDEIETLNSKINRLQSEINNVTIKAEPKKLKAIKVSAIGVRIVSENVLETTKVKNTQKIKVCFILEDNTSIEKGAKDIFIQVINPKSNIVGKTPFVLEVKDKTLLYSTKTSVNFDKEDVDVCVFVDANQNNLLKGNYIVNIFSGTDLIGNTNFTLK